MDLHKLDQTNEITMRTRRDDGSWSSRPIWVVAVDGDAYVRSYRAERGAWYRHAVADGRGEITAGQETVPVGFEAVDDEVLEDRVSEAYRSKYAATAPGPTESMVADEVRATTLRLTFPPGPAGQSR